MAYIEMSRDEDHGGGSWAFTNCVWAPTKKENGSSWPYWKKVSEVREGDVVIHLRGIPPKAQFEGYSIASGDGFQTTRRPPLPGKWDFAKSFYRADLSGFVKFHQPVNVTDLLLLRRDSLNSYFNTNRKRKRGKLHLFFDRKKAGLQCHQGAYLTDVDEALLSVLFGNDVGELASKPEYSPISVETRSQITSVWSRIGQARFSAEIKKLFQYRCCFPGCDINDPRFLIGAHIDRWSDNEALRGEMGNGLCFCLLHDKAFEVGMFTLNEEFRIFVNPGLPNSDSKPAQELIEHHGEQITLSTVIPLEDALLGHWIRTGLEP